METLIKELVNIANECEKVGLTKEASNIDKVSQSLLNIKTAQYVGIQGYWIRNERCWSNCYRIKRTTKPKLAAQEIWQECQKEYVESINNDKSGWEKYAEDDNSQVIQKFASIGMEKQAEKIIANEKKSFNDEVQNKVKGGLPFETAVFTTIEESNNKYANNMLDEAEKILIIAKKINKEGNKELGKKLAQLSFGVIKEAQARGFWGGLKGLVNKIPGVAGLGGGRERNMMARLGSLAQEITKVQNAFENNQVDVRYMKRPIQNLRAKIREDLQIVNELARQKPSDYMLQQLARQVKDMDRTMALRVEPAVAQGNMQGVTQLLGEMSNIIQNVTMKDFSSTNQTIQQRQQGTVAPGSQTPAGQVGTPVAPQASPATPPINFEPFLQHLRADTTDFNDPVLKEVRSIVMQKQNLLRKSTPAATTVPPAPTPPLQPKVKGRGKNP